MLQGPLNAVSGSATLDLDVEVRDQETDELIDLTGMTISFQATPSNNWPSDGQLFSGQTALTASTDDGAIMITAIGEFNVLIDADIMRAMAPGDYDCGFTAKDVDGYVTAIFLGTMNILPGIVRNP